MQQTIPSPPRIPVNQLPIRRAALESAPGDEPPLMLLPEQPVDAIRLIRYARHLSEIGEAPDILAGQQAAQLFCACPFVRRVLGVPPRLPRMRRPLRMAEVENHFGPPLDGAEDTPYLFPEQGVLAGDRSGNGPIRIGVWIDGPSPQADPHRTSHASINSQMVSGLFEGLNCRVFALGPQCRYGWRSAVSPGADLAELAAFIQGLDLVIAVDSVAAHLAGAMAVPTWLLLDTEASLLWQVRRPDTHWYTGMRLFRRRQDADWSAMLNEVRGELTKLIAARHGELPEHGSVSCLCVTRGRPALLRRAVYCFDRQTHPYKQLVIVAEDDDLRTLDFLQALKIREDVRSIIVPASPKRTLGELRNLAVSAASGEWVAQWDDDDFYHPGRLAAQIAEAERAQRPACLLYRWLIRMRGKCVVSGRRCWEGSLVCRRSEIPKYPALARGEDSVATEVLMRRNAICLLDRPGLFVYEYHGANTWDAGHWEELVDCSGATSAKRLFPVLAELAWYESGRAFADDAHALVPGDEAAVCPGLPSQAALEVADAASPLPPPLLPHSRS